MDEESDVTPGSRVEGVWRGARDALARVNRLLPEADGADDKVFHVRNATNALRSADRERRPLDSRQPSSTNSQL